MRKKTLKSLGQKAATFFCIGSMLIGNVCTVQADPLDDIGDWVSDRADDAANLANEAGQAISDSAVGQFVEENASAAGEFISENATVAGEFISENASAAGEWIAEQATAAGIWISDNAAIAGSFLGENTSAAGEWLGENASNAGDWIVENGIIVGAWIGETASGAGMWIGENASATGTWIGETASGAEVWISGTVSDIGKWIEENALYAKDGVVVLGEELEEWGIDQEEELEEIAVGINEYVSNMDPSVYLTKEYYMQTGEKLLLGEYSDASATGLSVGLNVVASIVNLDMAMDLRDLVYDIQYIGDGSVGIVDLGIDAASCLPVIGVVKNVKYLDEIKDAAKAIDGMSDVADSVKDASKIADVVDDVKDVSKAAEVVDGIKDASNAAELADSVKDASNAAEVVDEAKDVSKVTDAVDDVKEVSNVTDTLDEVKDVDNASDAADEMKNASKAADSAADAKDEESVSQVVQNKYDGIAREEDVMNSLTEEFGKDNVIREAYLRDAEGNIIKDPITGTARRIDFVVTDGDKVVQSIEVTSKTASKVSQTDKELRILEEAKNLGGAYVRDPQTGKLIE